MAKLTMIGPRLATLNPRRVSLPEKVAAPIYSSKEYSFWREAVVERSGGYCQDPECARPNHKPTRLFADHVVEIQDGGAKFDPANGLARCGGCHTRKTARERAKRFGLTSGTAGS